MLIPNLRRSVCVAFPALVAAALSISCGGSDGSEVEGGAARSNSNGTAGNGQPNLGNGSGGSSLGGPGGINGPGGTMVITRDAACAINSATADAIPAVVQMVVDISGSMEWAPGEDRDPRNGEQSKWEITSAALKDAVANLPASVAVGLNFYPNNPGRGQCIRNSVGVPLAPLGDAGSAQRNTFDEAIDGARPDDGTPTHAAFVFGAETVAASDLAGRKFVLLITDGVPTFTLECRGDGMTAVDNDPLIAEVGKTFLTQQISTFVIGSPGSEGAREDLSTMASVGNTASAGCSDAGPQYCHLDMTSATDFGAALAAGLADIAGRISACEYTVPTEAPDGQTIDKDKVNVIYTKGDGTEHSIPQDGTGMCSAGWVYNADRTQITLCGADCDAVKTDPGAKIELILGCDTATGEPPK